MTSDDMSKPTLDDILFCPQCGTKLPEGSVFCPGCGVSIAAQLQDAGQPEDTSPAPSDVAVTSGSEPEPVAAPVPAPEPEPEPVQPVTSEQVIGLGERDARQALRTLYRAQNAANDFQGRIESSREAIYAWEQSRRMTRLVCIACGVITGVCAVALGVLVMIFGVWDTVMRLVSVAGIVYLCGAVVLISSLYLLIRAPHAWRMRTAAAEAKTSIDVYERSVTELAQCVNPLLQLLPSEYRTSQFLIRVGGKLGVSPTVGEALLDSGLNRDFISDEREQVDVSELDIDGIARRLGEIIIAAEDRDKAVTVGAMNKVGLFASVLTMVISMLVAIALCAGTMVFSTSVRRTYVAGTDDYPAWMPHAVLNDMYRDCSSSAPPEGKSSRMAYTPGKLMEVTLDGAKEQNPAQRNGSLAQCVWQAMGGSKHSTDDVVNFFGDMVEPVEDGNDIDEYSRAQYIQQANLTIRAHRDFYTSVHATDTVTLFIAEGKSVTGKNAGGGEETYQANRTWQSINDLYDDVAKQRGKQQHAAKDDETDDSGDQQTQSAAPAEPDYELFKSLFDTVYMNNDMTPLAGNYCRNDGSCVTIAGNTIAMSKSSGNDPLPPSDGGNAVTYVLHSTLMGGPGGYPSEAQPITLCADDVSDMRCQAESGRMQLGLIYVQPGVDVNTSMSGLYGSTVDASNPPDRGKAYLYFNQRRPSRQSIEWQQLGPLSGDTVFYRQ